MMDQMRSEIRAQLGRGVSLDDVDAETIKPSPLSEDAKAALWLYGFCLLSRPEQCEFVEDTLRVLA